VKGSATGFIQISGAAVQPKQDDAKLSCHAAC